MVRIMLGVITGYLAMAVLVVVAFSLTYLGLGASRSFLPDSYEVSAVWIIVSIGLSFLAAVAGGYLAVRVGKNQRTAPWLAGVVLVLGFLSVLPQVFDQKAPVERPGGELTNYEAMMKARQPIGLIFLNPFIGVIGVMLGARMLRGHVDED